MGSLDGKVIVVTGAANGMGRNHVRWLAQEGADVVATDVQADVGRKVVDEIGGSAVFVEHDVTDEAAWDTVVTGALERFGHIDGLVNNAGIIGWATLEDETFEAFQRHLQVNLHGTWWGIRKVTGPLRDAGGGSIVNLSSTAGMNAVPGISSYATSKWAVRGLTKAAALELGPSRIRVNSVHPGGIEHTGMFPPAATEEEAQVRRDRVPLGRSGTVDDVSAMVAFLLSDASGFTTGIEHVVDGGYLLSN
jgi:3alpha(or 20beta)-hydroxysteroid dehydrogenase